MKVLLLLIGLLLVLASSDEDLVYLEEEQIRSELAPQVIEAKIVTPVEAPSLRESFNWDISTLLRYRYELMAVGMILIYLLNYRRGRTENSLIIESMYRYVEPYLEEQFSHIGFSTVSGQSPFLGESGNQALYYATGRANLNSFDMRFSMRKRQDLLYSWVYELVFPQKDEIILDINLKVDTPIVLLVATKKKVKECREQHLDISQLVGQFEVAHLNSNYVSLGESVEILSTVIDNYVCKRLNEHSGLFLSIHYTDQQNFSPSKGHLRMVLNATYAKPEAYVTALQVAFHIVDHISEMKMTANLKAKALKAREKFNQSKEKEELQKHKEEMRKKKEDKLRQEEAWLRSLPPEKQKREDQKRKKKEMSKMLRGKTMKVG